MRKGILSTGNSEMLGSRVPVSARVNNSRRCLNILEAVQPGTQSDGSLRSRSRVTRSKSFEIGEG